MPRMRRPVFVTPCLALVRRRCRGRPQAAHAHSRPPAGLGGNRIPGHHCRPTADEHADHQRARCGSSASCRRPSRRVEAQPPAIPRGRRHSGRRRHAARLHEATRVPTASTQPRKARIQHLSTQQACVPAPNLSSRCGRPLRWSKAWLDRQPNGCILSSWMRSSRRSPMPADASLLDRLRARERPDAGRTVRPSGHDAAGGQQASGDPGGRQPRRDRRRGREKLHYLNPVPIHEIAERWIEKFERSRLACVERPEESTGGET